MDSFYAEVERVRLGLPADRPLVVQQWESLIAVNYPARRHGIARSRGKGIIDPVEAKEACPHLVAVHVPLFTLEGMIDLDINESITSQARARRPMGKACLDRYREAGYKVIQIFKRFTPAVERASIDEAFIDITDLVEARAAAAAAARGPEWWRSESFAGSAVVTGPKSAIGGEEVRVASLSSALLCLGARLASEMRAAVSDELGYSCSAGVAQTKMLAKIASAANKPDGQAVVLPGNVAGFMADMPLKDIPGLGGKLGGVLAEALGATTAGEVLAAPRTALDAALAGARTLHASPRWVIASCDGSRNESVSPVYKPNSMLAQKRFKGLVDKSVVRSWVRILILEVATRISTYRQYYNGAPTTITLSSESSPPSGTISRSGSAQLPYLPKDPEKVIAAVSDRVLAQLDVIAPPLPVTLLTLSARNFVDLVDDENAISAFFTADQSPAEAEEAPLPSSTATKPEPAPGPAPASEPDIIALTQDVVCDRCGMQMLPSAAPAHRDFHLAADLHAQLNPLSDPSHTLGFRAAPRSPAKRSAPSSSSASTASTRPSKKAKPSSSASLTSWFGPAPKVEAEKEAERRRREAAPAELAARPSGETGRCESESDATSHGSTGEDEPASGSSSMAADSESASGSSERDNESESERECAAGADGAGASRKARRRPGVGAFGLTKQHFRLQTVFEKEPREIIEARKATAREPLVRPACEPGERFSTLRMTDAELDAMADSIPMPKRPICPHGSSKDAIVAAEEAAYTAWLESVYGQWPRERLNYFEHNLEVWRELWRVLAISDILCLLVDARAPLFHFPPSLYHHVTADLGKPLVLVLTKVDLVAPQTLAAWIKYFETKYPKLAVVPVSSLPNAPITTPTAYRTDERGRLLYRKRRRRKQAQRPPQGLARLAREIAQLPEARAASGIDWDELIDTLLVREERVRTQIEAAHDDARAAAAVEARSAAGDVPSSDDGSDEYVIGRKRGSFVTLGMIGHPNVGKSALINALMGKHVVSVKRTPGHTKALQTHFLTHNIQLSDCPGLIFPKVDMSKPLQVLCGLYPTSQVVEPFSAIRYLAERVPVEVVYELQLPVESDEDDDGGGPPRPALKKLKKAMAQDERLELNRMGKALSKARVRYVAEHLALSRSWKAAAAATGEPFAAATVAYLEDAQQWTAWKMCEAYAIKRGFFTPNTGRPDVYRAAIKMIYDVLDGYVVFSFLPPADYELSGPDEVDRLLLGFRHASSAW
ncbi:DNA polymerase eta [Thecamonas trahens ATCC 50062]|uniref:DNA polymerase eta n=1 Tax=Thecamonas trahens ATCC 50062 TaxID=461836 RepID=A0A0L0D820_THETB|nr:DNA polymerase eta [Thecamonas trahens ATCC 50062]KNC48527.1 DNA polymerase eta [Thecamonas trahens ATCC 50062]|eukprot:XP_013758635.1 DNA polymerase eta [Thecamonas trahens ATCC 50062]